MDLPQAVSAASWLEDASAWTDIISKIAQVAAIAIGGWWAYTRFIRQREAMPRATIKHEIQHLDLDDGRKVLRVVEEISNTGQVLLRMARRITRVQQILPMEDEPLAALEAGQVQEAPWFQIGKEHETVDDQGPPEIEPGERDHFEHDFLIDDKAEVVQVYSYFANSARGEADDRGWTITTIYDLREEGETKRQMKDLTAKEE